MIQIHLIISGKVQGVFFRDHTKTVADKLDIYGWVKNKPDGTVEVFAEGKETNINSFISWCNKGSTLAKVTNVKITNKIQINKPKYFGFDIIYQTDQKDFNICLLLLLS